LGLASIKEEAFTPAVFAGENATLISGLITANESESQITSVYTVNSPSALPAPDPGTFAIRYENNQGQALATYSFEPNDISVSSEAKPFVLYLPSNTNASSYVLLHNGQVIASRSASNSPPTVSMVYPNGGEALTGTTATIRWSANDPDSDALRYVVQYSSDGGVTWQTLAVDWPSTTYDLNLEAIVGTTNALVRVLASDAFHTAQDQSDATFSVNKHLPEARIRTPLNSARCM
jgi:hypothetical protein